MSRQTRSLAAVLLVAVACRSAATVPEVPQLVRTAGDTLRRGELPGLRIVGLRPGASVELLASRLVVLERRDTTPAVPDTVLLAARVRFIADRRGRVVVDSQAPVEGDWQGVEPLGLLWAMRRAGPDMMRPSGLRPGQLDLAATVRGAVVSRRRLVLASASAGDARVVLGDGFAGAFAAPTAGGRHPALIALHGSEGGDTTAALALSRQFAALGYATFAVTYVAYGWTGGLPGVPAAFDSIPVETLDRVHQWMGRQANADTSRTGLWGVSKGAEFALVTAARRPWPRAVVACVGSDVMWAGFGRPAPANGVLTSWADSGGRLPAIPYDRYDDVFEGKATARVVHDRSRAAAPEAATAARIPIERTRAPLLLIGGDADEVWASAAMSRTIARTMRERAPTIPVDTLLFPAGGHGLCGVGTTPALVFGDESSPVARGTAAGAARAWRTTVEFLARHLRP